jgi:hypothetical protein
LRPQSLRRGSGDSMYTRKARATREAPRRGQRGQPEAREGQAGRPGVAERFVVPLKPGNAGGGKGPQFKTDAIRSEGVSHQGLVASTRFLNSGFLLGRSGSIGQPNFDPRSVRRRSIPSYGKPQVGTIAGRRSASTPCQTRNDPPPVSVRCASRPVQPSGRRPLLGSALLVDGKQARRRVSHQGLVASTRFLNSGFLLGRSGSIGQSPALRSGYRQGRP